MKEKGWDNVAAWYDGYLAREDTYQEKVILPNLLRMLVPTKGSRILDLACGQGYFAHHVALRGALVHGIDASAELIALAQEKGGEGETFSVGNAEMLDRTLGTYESIYSVLACENIKDIASVMKGIALHLAPRGNVILVLLHPAFRIPKHSDWGYDSARGLQYRRTDKYLSEIAIPISLAPFKGNDGTTTTTYHRSLQWYAKTFRAAGFAIVGMEEWISHKVSERGPRQKAEDTARKEFPLFLALELRKI